MCRFFLLIMSVSSLAEVLKTLIKASEWIGRAERKEVGRSP
jgi:hypothetical protein